MILTIIVVWYAVPFVATFAARWWETDLWIGNKWDERFDIRFISTCLLIGAVWPLFLPSAIKGFILVPRIKRVAGRMRKSRDLWQKRALRAQLQAKIRATAVPVDVREFNAMQTVIVAAIHLLAWTSRDEIVTCIAEIKRADLSSALRTLTALRAQRSKDGEQC